MRDIMLRRTNDGRTGTGQATRGVVLASPGCRARNCCTCTYQGACRAVRNIVLRDARDSCAGAGQGAGRVVLAGPGRDARDSCAGTSQGSRAVVLSGPCGGASDSCARADQGAGRVVGYRAGAATGRADDQCARADQHPAGVVLPGPRGGAGDDRTGAGQGAGRRMGRVVLGSTDDRGAGAGQGATGRMRNRACCAGLDRQARDCAVGGRLASDRGGRGARRVGDPQAGTFVVVGVGQDRRVARLIAGHRLARVKLAIVRQHEVG